MDEFEKYMNRCLELAQNGIGNTSPNPMVGALLVHGGKIIGEGFHQAFGESHAEVNAINNAIETGNKNLLEESTLFVSLEPCAHTGKTPPCSDLIIRYKIPEVVIGCLDPFPDVNGKGIQKLSVAGVKIHSGILENECLEMNRRFMLFHKKKRPYVILKFAQSANGIVAPSIPENKKISNDKTDILVHKWRSEEAAIMVGTNTVIEDNPRLTVRKWKGKNPVRIVIDRKLKLNNDFFVFDDSAPVLVLNELKEEKNNTISYVKIDFENNPIRQFLDAIYKRTLLSVLVEGGPKLIAGFINEGLWDEARIITAEKIISEGLQAPEIKGNIFSASSLTGDHIVTIRPF
jgi:diaminohydroxyphosphoribosylaminopyrimidine deaminase/5-amino-6-(5-phosphoribosylamino)uracil reductase